MDYSGGNERNITVGYKIKNHRKVSNKLIALPVLGLASLAMLIAFGATTNVNADTCPAATCSDTTTVQVTVGSVISLATPDKISISMAVPSSDGTFASGSGNIGVSTNDTSGYSVYLTGVSGGNTELRHSDYNGTTNTSKLTTITSSQTIATGEKFSSNNTWGWSANASDYYPLQAYGQKHTATVTTRFANKDESTISKSCTVDGTAYSNYECSTLTIGATGDTSLLAGTYTGTILVTAVPNSYSSISDYDETK